MKRAIQLFALLPCTLFLMPQPRSSQRVLEVYEKLLFKTAASWITSADLSELHERGTHNPEALFELPGQGASEREPVRHGLIQLRLFLGNDLTAVTPDILKLIESKLHAVAQQQPKQEELIAKLEKPMIGPFVFRAGRFLVNEPTLNDHGLLFVSPVENSRKIEIWNIHTQTQVLALPDLYRYDAVTYMGDNRHLALSYSNTGAGPFKFGIFDLQTETFKFALDMPVATINTGSKDRKGGLWVSHNSRYVMGKNQQTKNFIVWDSIADGSVELKAPSVRSILNVPNTWRVARFLPNNNVVTIDTTHIHHWDPKTGSLLKTIELPFVPLSQTAEDPDTIIAPNGALSANGKYWVMAIKAVSDDDHFQERRLIDLETGEVVISRSGEKTLKKTDISPDNKSLLIVDGEKLEIIDIASKRLRFSIPCSSRLHVHTAFSPDSKYLIADNWNGDTHIVNLWDLEKQKIVSQVGTPHVAVSRYVFSSDGKHIITHGGLGKVHVWSLESLHYHSEDR